MATILVVDDRAANREYLVTLLRYGGHRLVEAADGAEGLAAVRADRPDLVIADILMPTMDGYEFVRQLRADPAVAATRVVFYTAHYHEAEARALAATCGVAAVLTKPAEPELVIRTVEAVLRTPPDARPTPPPPPDPGAFDREHLRLLTDKLSQKSDELRRNNERLTALVELGMRLGSERDLTRLLQSFCDSAREIVGARYALVGIPNGDGAPYRFFLTGGMDPATAARVGRLGPLAGVLGTVLSAGRCFRAASHGGFGAVGVPPSFPAAAALLAAPITSPARVYGWVCLLDKVGADGFTDEDEGLARMLGAQVGRIYENGSLYAELLRHSTTLAEEVAERKRAEAEVYRTTTLLRAVAEGTTDAVFVKDRAGKYLFFNPAAARFVGRPVADVLGRDDTALFDPDSARVAMANDRKVMASGAVETAEEVLTAAGVTRTFLATKGPYRDGAGAAIGVIGISRDITDRKRAEERAVLFRTLVDHARDGIEVIDPDTGRYLDVNERACQTHGYTRDEYLRLNVSDLNPAVTEGNWAATVAGHRREELRTVELSHRRKDGSLFPVEVNLNFIRLDREYLVAVVRDITDRKRAEERSVLFRALVDQATDSIEVIDPETGRFLDVNERACVAHGYTRDEYLRLSVSDIDPVVAERGWAATMEHRRTNHLQTFEGRHRRKDGSVFPVEVNRTFIRLDREYLVAVVRDITDRKRAEAALQAAQRRLEQVIASSPSVLFTLTVADDRIRGVSWTSDTLRDLFGYPPEAATGTAWWVENIHPDDRERAVERAEAELFDRGRSSVEYRFRHADGTHRWTRCDVRLVRDTAGRPVEAVGSWSDVTQLHLIEEQFRQAQRMEAVGRLAGGVAHDFNNLLTVINGFGEVVLDRLPPVDPSRELLREVVRAGGRAATLTRQLLAFSRKAIIEPRPLDLRAAVADVEKMLRHIIGEDIRLAIATDPAVGPVLADPGQIEQVVLNLVVNARDAMPRGGHLTIEVRDAELDAAYARAHPEARPGPHVVLAVTDTGCGMSAETAARAFEPFFTTKGESGTGLGLATVHGIVKQSGGHVAVYSEVGRGTVFKVYLPRHDAAPPPKSRPPQPVPRGGGETILLVEDEDAVRALTRYLLAGNGYAVLEAADGPEALRLAAEYRDRIDLLMTDVVMPRMSGREVAEHLRRARPEIRVLYLSGYTDDAVVRHGVLEAEVAFLQKPFTAPVLARKVRDVLDGG